MSLESFSQMAYTILIIVMMLIYFKITLMRIENSENDMMLGLGFSWNEQKKKWEKVN